MRALLNLGLSGVRKTVVKDMGIAVLRVKLAVNEFFVDKEDFSFSRRNPYYVLAMREYLEAAPDLAMRFDYLVGRAVASHNLREFWESNSEIYDILGNYEREVSQGKSLVFHKYARFWEVNQSKSLVFNKYAMFFLLSNKEWNCYSFPLVDLLYRYDLYKDDKEKVETLKDGIWRSLNKHGAGAFHIGDFVSVIDDIYKGSFNDFFRGLMKNTINISSDDCDDRSLPFCCKALIELYNSGKMKSAIGPKELLKEVKSEIVSLKRKDYYYRYKRASLEDTLGVIEGALYEEELDQDRYDLYKDDKEKVEALKAGIWRSLNEHGAEAFHIGDFVSVIDDIYKGSFNDFFRDLMKDTISISSDDRDDRSLPFFCKVLIELYNSGEMKSAIGPKEILKEVKSEIVSLKRKDYYYRYKRASLEDTLRVIEGALYEEYLDRVSRDRDRFQTEVSESREQVILEGMEEEICVEGCDASFVSSISSAQENQQHHLSNK